MNQAADSKPHPLVVLRNDLKAALPTFGLKDEREQMRMSSVLMVAVERAPELVYADRQSLIAAVRQCANHGLVPDGNEATLQVYETKVKLPDGTEKWIKKVQYQPMVRGIINRVLRSGKVLSFWADLVYAGEDFSIDISHGDRRPIHNPNHFSRGGEIVGVYAVARLANGTIDCEPMTMAELKKVRGVAKTQKVWDAWFEEKAKVAVMRRMSKRLPLSSEDMDFIMNREEHDFEQRDVTPKETAFQRLTAAARSGIAQEHPAHESAQDGDTVDAVAQDASEPKTSPYEALDVSDAAPGSQAWDRGLADFDEGRPISDCPYDIGTPEAVDFCGAWRMAQRARE